MRKGKHLNITSLSLALELSRDHYCPEAISQSIQSCQIKTVLTKNKHKSLLTTHLKHLIHNCLYLVYVAKTKS